MLAFPSLVVTAIELQNAANKKTECVDTKRVSAEGKVGARVENTVVGGLEALGFAVLESCETLRTMS